MRHIDGNAVIREISVFDIRHGHSNSPCRAGTIAQAFISAKVEELVTHDLPSSSTTELIAFERRLWRAVTQIKFVKEISGVQRAVSQKVVRRPMKFVGSSLGDGVDLSGTATVFSGVGIGLNFELLDFVDRRNGRDGIEIGRSVDRAVEKKIGVLGACAAHGVLILHTTTDVADFLK